MANVDLRISLTLDGRPVRSETLRTFDGPYGLAFSTTLPSEGLALHSTYQGSPQSETTAISHVLLPLDDASTEVAQVAATELPIDRERQRCLYHHLQRLQDLASEAQRGELRVDGLDAAVTLLTPS